MGLTTMPERILGVKKVDFGGMRSPVSAVRLISARETGRINTALATCPDAISDRTSRTPC